MIKLFFSIASGLALLFPTGGLAIDLRMPDGAEPGRSRVVVVGDAQATEAFRPRPAVVEKMVERGLALLTGKKEAREAWGTLVTTQDVVGIKVFSAPGPFSGTRPAVVGAVIQGLLRTGLPPHQIIIWDRHGDDLVTAGFDQLAATYGVRLSNAAAEGYDDKVFYETPLLGNLIWGDFEFGKKGDGVGRRSFVTRLMTKSITKVINIAPLLNHNIAGVTGNLFSLAMGSVDNTVRFESFGERMANAIPEIYAMEAVGDRVVLNIVDALICQYEGGERGLLHYSKVLNELRFSKDPVALDVLSLEELRRHRVVEAKGRKDNESLYSNASILELGSSSRSQIRIETAP